MVPPEVSLKENVWGKEKLICLQLNVTWQYPRIKRWKYYIWRILRRSKSHVTYNLNEIVKACAQALPRGLRNTFNEFENSYRRPQNWRCLVSLEELSSEETTLSAFCSYICHEYDYIMIDSTTTYLKISWIKRKWMEVW